MTALKCTRQALLYLLLLLPTLNFIQAQQVPIPSCGTLDAPYVPLANRSSGTPADCQATGIIPMVFHIISDLSPGCIQQDMNYDVTEINDLIEDINTSFTGLNVEFVLADKDTQGKGFNGITRRSSIHTHNAGQLNRGLELARFPAEQYLNIWVVDQVNQNNSSGVAFFPGTPGQGIIMASFAMPGHTNYNQPALFETIMQHEIGHWLGLRHIWSSTNVGPGFEDNCELDDSDFLDEFQTANPNFEFCECMDPWGFDDDSGDTPQTTGYDPLAGCGLNYEPCEDGPDPLESNYMDYTCSNDSFTPWQLCIMNSMLANSNACGGRNDLIDYVPCEQDPACNPWSLDPEGTTFYESFTTPGLMVNSIRIQLGENEVSNLNWITSGLNGSPIITYHTAPEGNFLLMRLGNIQPHEVDVPFSISFIPGAFTNPVCNPRLEFFLDFVDDEDCDIVYNNYENNPEVQTDGTWFFPFNITLPFLTDKIAFQFSFDYPMSNDQFNFTSITADGFNVDFASSNGNFKLPVGTVIGPDLDYTPTLSLDVATQEELFYIGFRITSPCGTPFYGWFRFFTPNECTQSLRLLDMAMQENYGTDIVAGQTDCDCDCTATLVASSNTFDESPNNQGTYNPIHIFYESDGCNTGGGFPLNFTPNPIPGYTIQTTDDEIIITPTDPPTAPLTIDFSNNGNDLSCVGGTTTFTFTPNPYVIGFDCTDINQTVPNGPPGTTIAVVLGAGIPTMGFSISRTSDVTFNITGNSLFDTYLAGDDILFNGAFVTKANPILISGTNFTVNVPANPPSTNFFLPFMLDLGCGDDRLAYVHFTEDCCGNIYVYDITYATDPYSNILIIDETICDNVTPTLAEWKPIPFDHEITDDEVCFTAEDWDINIEYREVGFFEWMPVGASDCIDLSALLSCTTYEYRIQYFCFPYGWSDWSDEWNPSTVQTFETECCELPDNPFRLIYRCATNILMARSNILAGDFHQYRFKDISVIGPWTNLPVSTEKDQNIGTVPECVTWEVQVRMRCIDSNGNASWSDWSESLTYLGRPENLDPTSVTVEFTDPTTAKVCVKNDTDDFVTFQWNNDGGNQFPNTIIVPPFSESCIIITDLVPGETFCYRFRTRSTLCNRSSCFRKICVDVPTPDPEEPCDCDYIYVVDKSPTMDEDLEDVECRIIKEVNDIDERCPGCDSRFALVTIAGDFIVQDYPMNCGPFEDIGDPVDPTGPTNILQRLGTMYGWLLRGGFGQFEDGRECLKMKIFTDANCEAFTGTFTFGNETFTFAELVAALKEKFGLELCIVHYPNVDENGNQTNGFGECGPIQEAFPEGGPGGVTTVEEDCEKKKFAPLGGDRSTLTAENHAVNVFPNPFERAINFDLDLTSQSNIRLEVYNSLGQKVWQRSMNALEIGTHRITLSENLAPGTYYYQLDIGDKKYTGKLIKI